MSFSNDLDRSKHEIIIVRRSGEIEDAHHGGVWKIAFADFMTAMMAFFLVMWLTNSSDDATKKQIAQYFNPIQLNDSTPSARGLDTGNAGAALPIPDRGSGRVETPGDPSGRPVAGDADGGQEAALFRDPYAVLAQIVAEGGPGTGEKLQDNGKPDGSGQPGLNGGEAYRDPFDPQSWQLQPNAVATGEQKSAAPPDEFKTTVVAVKAPAPASAAKEAGKPAPTAAVATPAANPPVAKAQADAAPKPRTDAAPKPEDEKLHALKTDIAEKLAAIQPNAPSKVEVSEGNGSVTISLADNIDSGMFEVGSAKPTAAAILMMEKIAKVLSSRKGQIVIRGYTDARPYKGGSYDNWRLSTDRAHMAYYMLARGGLDTSRVQTIEGFADRKLKIPSDPENAANRRIEILLTEPKA